jgi:hypothetical protein
MARRWRQSEDAALARAYADGVPIRAIAEFLGRSEEGLSARRRLLGIAPRRVPVVWSASQDALICAAACAGLPASKVAVQLRVSVDQVRRRRTQLLGVQTAARHYQPWEDEAIRAAWTSGPVVDELARRLGRSPDAIRLRARALGVHSPASRLRWTRLEDHVLRRAYADGLSCTEISDSCLPRRSAGSVAARAHKLGLTSYARRWTNEEDVRLRLLLTRGGTIDQIALALVRTPEAIRQRVRKLGADGPATRRRRQHGERWSAADDAVLRENLGAHPSVLGSILGRSDLAVRRRQRELELRTGNRSPHHAPAGASSFAPAEDRLLRRELGASGGAHGKRTLALAARLGHPPGELRRRLGELQAR